MDFNHAKGRRSQPSFVGAGKKPEHRPRRLNAASSSEEIEGYPKVSAGELRELRKFQPHDGPGSSSGAKIHPAIHASIAGTAPECSSQQ
jgi:hypothetical protein